MLKRVLEELEKSRETAIRYKDDGVRPISDYFQGRQDALEYAILLVKILEEES